MTNENFQFSCSSNQNGLGFVHYLVIDKLCQLWKVRKKGFAIIRNYLVTLARSSVILNQQFECYQSSAMYIVYSP